MRITRPLLLALTTFLAVGLSMTANAAVSSTGELNVLGDPSGRVPTASRPTLILTLLVDRSQAEPGEEIKTVEVVLPPFFTVEESDVQDLRIEGVSVGFQAVVTATSIRFTLDNEIDNFLSSVIEATFDVGAPDAPQPVARFQVILRNLDDRQIGEFVKPGEIDGDPTNNNDYTLEVIPNIPPETPVGLTAVADPEGDNDVILAWEVVDDPDVRGYFVSRDNGPPIDAPGADTTTYRDVNVEVGAHSYTVAAYKSRLIVSPTSSSQSVFVMEDTRPPDAVPVISVAQVERHIEIRWRNSASPDVVRYDALFGRFDANPTVLESREPEPGIEEHVVVHRAQLAPGRYRYVVVAVDENDNVSAPREQFLALLDTPFPNPFTPLGSAPFNEVTFPRRGLAQADGDLIVRVFDLHGRELWESQPSVGNVTWDGRDISGALAPGGVYIYQMEIGRQFRVGSLVLIR